MDEQDALMTKIATWWDRHDCHDHHHSKSSRLMIIQHPPPENNNLVKTTTTTNGIEKRSMQQQQRQQQQRLQCETTTNKIKTIPLPYSVIKKDAKSTQNDEYFDVRGNDSLVGNSTSIVMDAEPRQLQTPSIHGVGLVHGDGPNPNQSRLEAAPLPEINEVNGCKVPPITYLSVQHQHSIKPGCVDFVVDKPSDDDIYISDHVFTPPQSPAYKRHRVTV
jgi:hypothetical protein